MANKNLLAAGIVRDFRFVSKGAYLTYCRGLHAKKIKFVILESRLCQDGTVLARFVQQYNQNPLIQLSQSDLEV